MTWIRRDAGRSPKKADTSIPSKYARNAAKCSVGIAAAIPMFTRAESMIKTSCFAQSAGTTYFLNKAENLFRKIKGYCPMGSGLLLFTNLIYFARGKRRTP